MHILIIGAAGMVGRKLTHRLIKDGILNGKMITKLTLTDIITPLKPDFNANCFASDISKSETAAQLAQLRPDVIFHLAAIVSGEAEVNFDLGYAINLDGARFLFEAIRQEGLRETYYPKVIFTSSIAVFGAPFPDKIPDDYHLTPLTSYGTQKAIGELLLADYSRKGFMDGIGIRLPTICVRPGLPNKAASGFFSNIMREPLIGKEAILPVSRDVMHWHASPRAAIGFLLHAASLNTELLGARRTLSMPGLAITVGEQIEALRRVAGEKVVSLIKSVPDETIAKIVAGWPRNFETSRASALGFKAEANFDEIIRVHIEDELS